MTKDKVWNSHYELDDVLSFVNESSYNMNSVTIPILLNLYWFHWIWFEMKANQRSIYNIKHGLGLVQWTQSGKMQKKKNYNRDAWWGIDTVASVFEYPNIFQ